MAADDDQGAASPTGADSGAQQRIESLRRRVFSLPAIISILVAAGFLLFLITRFDVDINETWRKVRAADPWLLVAAFAVHYTTFLFRGARWRLLLEHSANTSGESEPVPSVLFCSRAVLLGWFVNSIGWLRLGDAYRAYLYREEHNAAFSGAIGTVLAERVLDVVLVALMLLVTAPLLIGQVGGGAAWGLVTLTAVILVVLLFVVLTLLVRLRGLLLRWLPEWLASRYERFLYGATAVRYKLPQTTLLGILGWMAEIGRMYLVAMALGFELGVAMVVFLTLANSMLSLVPTPGGIGAVESGVAGLAVRLSALAKESATALILVDRFITYISVIIVGAVLFAVRPVFRRRAVAKSSQGTPSP